jgi:thiosulfate/3-mercaptopyruvate sulfurtransferase
VLVSTEWLAANLHERGPVVVDLRWRPDGSGRDRYERGHIPGAVFCDWATDLVQPDHPIAFMLAGPERVTALVRRLGIADDTPVVAYSDALGSGPFRLWWACRRYGHDQARILDGGLDLWMAEGRPLETGLPVARAASWSPRPGEPLVCGADDVAAAENADGTVVLDSRPPDQFRGEFVWFETGPIPAGPDGIAHTPRGDIRAGRVPWARSVPWARLYRADHRLLPADELRTLFARAGVTEGTRVLTYCGSGISASALTYALWHAGIGDVALYDASWEEWGRDRSRPVARGP